MCKVFIGCTDDELELYRSKGPREVSRLLTSEIDVHVNKYYMWIKNDNQIKRKVLILELSDIELNVLCQESVFTNTSMRELIRYKLWYMRGE